jgi:hypothetical protein
MKTPIVRVPLKARSFKGEIELSVEEACGLRELLDDRITEALSPRPPPMDRERLVPWVNKHLLGSPGSRFQAGDVVRWVPGSPKQTYEGEILVSITRRTFVAGSWLREMQLRFPALPKVSKEGGNWSNYSDPEGVGNSHWKDLYLVLATDAQGDQVYRLVGIEFMEGVRGKGELVRRRGRNGITAELLRIEGK